MSCTSVYWMSDQARVKAHHYRQFAGWTTNPLLICSIFTAYKSTCMCHLGLVGCWCGRYSWHVGYSTGWFTFVPCACHTGAQPASCCQSNTDSDTSLQLAEMKWSISVISPKTFFFNNKKAIHFKNTLTYFFFYLQKRMNKCDFSWTSKKRENQRLKVKKKNEKKQYFQHIFFIFF